MAIKLGQQAPGATAGIMAYTAGLNRARQRRQKSMTDMLRMGMGQRYRAAMEREARGMERFPQAQWEDPLALAQTPEEKALINAQRKANARRRRLGKPELYPEAKMQFKRGKPKEKIELEKVVAEEGRAAKREQERWGRGVALEQEKHKRGVKQQFAQEALGLAKTRYNEQLARINEIRKQGRSAWREPDEGKHKEFKKLNQALDIIRKNLSEADPDELPQRLLESYRTAANKMAAFLSDFDASIELLPLGEREGAEPIVRDVGGVPMFTTPPGGPDWKPVPQRKPDPSSTEQAAEQLKNRVAFMKNWVDAKGLDWGEPADRKQAAKAADAEGLTMPGAAVGGGDQGAPSPTFGAASSIVPGLGFGGEGLPSGESPEENPEVQARAQTIIAELEEKVRAGGPEGEAARIALEKMKPTTVPNPFGF